MKFCSYYSSMVAKHAAKDLQSPEGLLASVLHDASTIYFCLRSLVSRPEPPRGRFEGRRGNSNAPVDMKLLLTLALALAPPQATVR